MRRAPPNKYGKLPPKFPVELPRRCIKLQGCTSSDLVVDPFMGLGTTAVACKQLNVRYIGFEIDDLIADLAEERVKQ
jgi:site-specific DNA-methyltransferase (adenine-specific)